MESPRKVIVGYDLCEDFAQISCYSYKEKEPVPISVWDGEEEACLIPTLLCVRSDTRQWLFGDEAEKCVQNGMGIKVDQLLQKARNGEVIELYQTRFTGVALLEKFLRKSLSLIKNYFPTEPISKLVVTIRDTDPVLVDRIYEALDLLGIEKDRAVVMSHAGAYLYYALSQDKSLWMNDVGLFDFSREGLRYYQIRINRRSKPIIAGLIKKDYSDHLKTYMSANKGNHAYVFENITNEVLYKQIVSTLYFSGCGFEGGWADEVIKGLCNGRRVFYGQNLFTKGACYAAKELSGERVTEDVLILNDDMITTSLFIKVFRDSEFVEVALAKAGDIWYEVKKSYEVIVEGAAELDIIRMDIMTKEVLREKLLLSQIPVRPDRTTRLEISFTCKNKDMGILKVTDLGFGEFFPETGGQMIFEIAI